MKRVMYVGFGALLVLYLLLSAAPSSADPPSDFCAGLSGATLGLCRTYCDGLGCPGRNTPECNRLRILLGRKTGETQFPCDGVCGNGAADAGEQCGEPGLSECTAPLECRDCQCRGCGDGLAEGGEQCGEPTLPPCFRTESCVECRCIPNCGNGRIDAGEECERGLPVPACPANEVCGFNCKCTSCGNGVVERPREECEATEHCPFGEICDRLTCRCIDPDDCGNGIVEEGEECDPGGSTLQLQTDGFTVRIGVPGLCPPTACTEDCTCPVVE